jgi:methylated-DNA-[protein]-cysteine S-methyltransferase
MTSNDTELRWATVETPIGTLRVAATARGVVKIALRGSEAGFQREIEQRFGAAPVRDEQGLSDVRESLRRYLEGRCTSLDFPADLTPLPDFHRRVLEELRRVPRGTVVSYGELARRAGSPGAARAVGRAMGANPLPILYPCHRVVPADGSLGRFGGGRAMKRAQLELEGALLPLGTEVAGRRGRNSDRLRQAAPGQPPASSRRTVSRA